MGMMFSLFNVFGPPGTSGVPQRSHWVWYVVRRGRSPSSGTWFGQSSEHAACSGSGYERCSPTLPPCLVRGTGGREPPGSDCHPPPPRRRACTSWGRSGGSGGWHRRSAARAPGSATTAGLRIPPSPKAAAPLRHLQCHGISRFFS